MPAYVVPVLQYKKVKLLFICTFTRVFYLYFLKTKWRQRYFETQSTISPQAPAALWRLYGVVSMVTVTAVMAVSADWLGTSEVEKE